MKKILWLTFIFTLLFVSHSFAAYNFKPETSGSTIKGTLTGAIKDRQYKLVLQTKNFEGDTYTGTIPTPLAFGTDTTGTVKKATTGTVTWSIPSNKAGTTYYMRVLEVTSSTKAAFVTPVVAITIPLTDISLLPLTTRKDGSDVIIEGKIDISKITNFKASRYSPRLVYTKIPALSGAKTLDGGQIESRKTDAVDGEIGINDDGTYYWRLTSLSPSTTYYIQQTVYEDNINPKVDVIANFNSDSGNIVTSAISQEESDKSRGYTLLSGFPNFSFLPDPDLCAQKIAENQGVRPANLPFCDMNDVINYFLKLLIGLAAVSLVFRIMYEGVALMTSDVPFRVASAKSSFFTAVLGLLLALTSYIILNTINPKLVESNVAVNQLAITVDEDRDGDVAYTSKPSGTLPSGKVGKCAEGVTSVNTAGGVFWVCKSYANNIVKMMAAAHAAGLNLSGGGFRTSTKQIELRKQHCGVANVYVEGARCKPPTAIPGNSNHESGLAFDLTCDGQTIKAKDNKCFIWLTKNAATYGLINYPAERWHWSYNGR